MLSYNEETVGFHLICQRVIYSINLIFGACHVFELLFLKEILKWHLFALTPRYIPEGYLYSVYHPLTSKLHYFNMKAIKLCTSSLKLNLPSAPASLHPHHSRSLCLPLTQPAQQAHTYKMKAASLPTTTAERAPLYSHNKTALATIACCYFMCMIHLMHFISHFMQMNLPCMSNFYTISICKPVSFNRTSFVER